MEKKRTTINLDIENFEYIKKLSRLENRSISNFLNLFIKDYKNNNKLTVKEEIKALRIGD